MKANSDTDSFLVDVGQHQQYSDERVLKRLTISSAIILACVHFGIVILGICWKTTPAIVLHGPLGCAACGFAVLTYLSQRQRVISVLGTLCILLEMNIFLFYYPGPRAIFVFILAPIPAFRVLGLRWGAIAGVCFILITIKCMFFYPLTLVQLHIETRVNSTIAMALALAFGFLFELNHVRVTQSLNQTLQHLKTFKGIVPVCAACKKIRDPDNQWHDIEALLHSEGHLEFSHGFCKECAAEWVGDATLNK